MFENLTDRLEKSFKMLKGEGQITELNVAETLKDIRKALLDADVNFKVAKQFTDNVKQKALGQEVIKSVKPGQMMVSIVYDELTTTMGGDVVDVNLKGNPAIVLMSGLQGSGKTTFACKLANQFKTQRGKKPLLVAGDVYRPAAINQLQVLGEQIGVPVFTEEGNQNPVDLAQKGIAKAKQDGCDVVIIDTARRVVVDEEMMNEIEAIKKAVKPTETLFVVDSMTGQDAVNTAREFNDRLDFDGVVLTKLDGDTRGGAALSIRAVTGRPIYYVGMGEKLSDLEQFYPDRMASRILGMGDVLSLIEKAEAEIDEEKAAQMAKKIKKAEFDFNDFLEQMQQMKKMGGLSSILSMLPGMGLPSDLEIDDDALKGTEAIIYSMTLEERTNPGIINPSRKRRIASGAGVDISEVNRLIKQFEQSRKMMKQMSGMMSGKGRKRGGFGGFKFPFGGM